MPCIANMRENKISTCYDDASNHDRKRNSNKIKCCK